MRPEAERRGEGKRGTRGETRGEAAGKAGRRTGRAEAARKRRSGSSFFPRLQVAHGKNVQAVRADEGLLCRGDGGRRFAEHLHAEQVVRKENVEREEARGGALRAAQGGEGNFAFHGGNLVEGDGAQAREEGRRGAAFAFADTTTGGAGAGTSGERKSGRLSFRGGAL